MKNSKKRKSTALGAFVILSIIVALATTVIMILHNTYGFF